MKSVKSTKIIKRKLFLVKPDKNIRRYFQLRTITDQLPPAVPTSPIENCMSVFRIMWNINMLLKNALNRKEIKETNMEDKRNICVNSIVKKVHKTIWKLKYLYLA